MTTVPMTYLIGRDGTRKRKFQTLQDDFRRALAKAGVT